MMVIAEYRINYFLELLVLLAQFVVFYIFWKSLLGNQAIIPGWNLGELVVLFSVQNFFLGILTIFGPAGLNLWKKIGQGELDKYLCRPTTAWFMLVGEGLRISLVGFGLGIAGLLAATIVLGVAIRLEVIGLLVIILLLAALITLFFFLSLSMLVFWIEKVEFANRIWEGLFEFQWYPQTLFPGWIQLITSFTVPFLFGHTIPAMALLGKISMKSLFFLLGAEIGILIINFVLFQILWRRGVTRYVSYGG
ncbi:MAG: ABC-2 family transporter protein [Candidatus Diapherotrites archaeon]|nr:ABC-2 family transporter protein [Candidatus Diapherotrites archaeon]MDZ4256636.1 ABC-2 family transporter protein [archaeon]